MNLITEIKLQASVLFCPFQMEKHFLSVSNITEIAPSRSEWQF
jgi:hypothetical protein